ncbi:KGG domain-containing protein [Escherichia coli]
MANHRGGSGNFAEDSERASEAGKKGGKSSHGKSDN